MGTLIFCKESIAANPYYIEEASLNVYSLEELSYYILNNVYSMDSGFMTSELVTWVERDLKNKKMAEELRSLLSTGSPLHIFVGHILSSSGYASNHEIKEALTVISSYENKSEQELKKMRADRLYSKDKLMDAIHEYENLLEEPGRQTMSNTVVGDIYHNLGCCYARLFFFDKAYACFDEAYKRNRKRSTARHLLITARCKKDEQLFNAAVLKYQLPKEEADDVLRIVKETVESNEIVSFDENINETVMSITDEEERVNSLAPIIEGWKSQYRKLSRI